MKLLRTGRPQAHRSSPWAFMERFEIPNLDKPSETYLTRWRIVQTPWFALYLHRMDGPDSRPTLHDHPWNFLSVVLRGGYVERRLNPQTREVREHHVIRWLNRVHTYDAHAITELLRTPTWTLLFVGRRSRVWGYLEGPYRTGKEWVWTRFDQHHHADEFDRAMAARRVR